MIRRAARRAKKNAPRNDGRIAGARPTRPQRAQRSSERGVRLKRWRLAIGAFYFGLSPIADEGDGHRVHRPTLESIDSLSNLHVAQYFTAGMTIAGSKARFDRANDCGCNHKRAVNSWRSMTVQSPNCEWASDIIWRSRRPRACAQYSAVHAPETISTELAEGRTVTFLRSAAG